MLRFDKMTVKAQEAVQESQEVAARHENQSIEPLHLLVALVEQKDGVVPPLLARLGIRSELLMQDLEREISRLPKVQGFGQHNMSRALNDVLERAFDEAQRLDRRSGIVPVPGRRAGRIRQDPAPLVVAQRLGIHPGPLGDFSRSHASSINPVPRYKVKSSEPARTA